MNNVLAMVGLQFVLFSATMHVIVLPNVYSLLSSNSSVLEYGPVTMIVSIVFWPPGLPHTLGADGHI